ncbi:MAG: tRNA (adenosine(37)-N6)-dimethylallyltransferase MiaA [Verrucomicrobiales bacterium]|nr:tRNA (adenosine(37)-N6)-dimethylallyltransferase MiaA [Verrucomicrobiales bacterium]
MKPFLIVGPTAAGKSALALTLAEKYGGVICAMDAFQVYRGLDLGTGKATVAEQAAVPHYLINLREPLASFSVADYLRETMRTLTVIPPAAPQIWVGGTGLYMRILRQGLSAAPPSDPALVRELAAWPLTDLQREIRRLDPVWAAGADLQNPRRIIRALTVVKGTGQPLSAWQQSRSAPLLPEVRGVMLLPARDLNRTLIAARVARMWAAGWPDEVRALLAMDGWRESQSARALGYLPIADYLAGKLSKPDCLAKIITLTGQYAKRQASWFKTEPGLMTAASVEEAARLIDTRFHEN